jgi:DNA-binding IclR family transcriptional regulator
MLGTLLMAYLTDAEVNRLLKKTPLQVFTKKSLTNVREFKRRFQTIRDQGFYIDKEEALEGVTGIAAPIRDYTGEVVAGVGVGFISSSVESDGVEKIIEELCETGKKISQEMGYLERKKLAGS